VFELAGEPLNLFILSLHCLVDGSISGVFFRQIPKSLELLPLLEPHDRKPKPVG